jgi:hypothetical protein
LNHVINRSFEIRSRSSVGTQFHYLLVKSLGVGQSRRPSFTPDCSKHRYGCVAESGEHVLVRAVVAVHVRHVVLRRGHVTTVTDLLADHSQLLKVNKALQLGVVAEVNKRKVLLYDGKERNLNQHTIVISSISYGLGLGLIEDRGLY